MRNWATSACGIVVCFTSVRCSLTSFLYFIHPKHRNTTSTHLLSGWYYNRSMNWYTYLFIYWYINAWPLWMLVFFLSWDQCDRWWAGHDAWEWTDGRFHSECKSTRRGVNTHTHRHTRTSSVSENHNTDTHEGVFQKYDKSAGGTLEDTKMNEEDGL